MKYMPIILIVATIITPLIGVFLIGHFVMYMTRKFDWFAESNYLVVTVAVLTTAEVFAILYLIYFFKNYLQ